MWALQPVQNRQQREIAGTLIREYLEWINESAQREYGLSFDIEAMLASDIAETNKFQPPTGRFYLAQNGDQIGGVGCLKQLQHGIGEVQRMYVRPEFRGQGIGRQIAERLIADARQIGYKKLRLESLKYLAAAHTLYRSLGFKEIGPYADNSMRDYHRLPRFDTYRTRVVFMEMDL